MILGKLIALRGNFLICRIVMMLIILLVIKIKEIYYVQHCVKHEVNAQKKNVHFFPFLLTLPQLSLSEQVSKHFMIHSSD